MTDIPWPLVAVPVACLCATTLVVTAPQLFLPDTALGWVDVWYYIGFALRLPDALRQHPDLYQAERIGWTLPLYFAGRLLSPLVTNYLVKTVFYVAMLTFLCGTLRLTCRWRTSLFVTVLAGFYCFVVHAIGAGYADGPATAYFVMALYFATRALGPQGRAVEAVAAGVCYMAALFTHFVYIAVLPMFAIYAAAVALHVEASRGSVSRFCIWFLVGASIVLLVVTGLYWDWRIPGRPLVASLGMLYGFKSNVLLVPDGGRWVMDAIWLVLPFITTGWAVTLMRQALRGGPDALRRLPPAFWLLSSMNGAWAILYVFGQPWIMLPFYSSYLMVPMFLALGPILARPIEQLSATSYWLVLATLFVVGPMSFRVAPLAVATPAALVAVVSLLIATWCRFAPRDRAVPFVAALILGVASVNLAGADYAAQVRSGYRHTAMNRVYDDQSAAEARHWNRTRLFEDAVTASTVLESRLGPGPFYFWYDKDEDLGGFFRSVTSTFFAWSTCHLLSEQFVDAKDATVRAAFEGEGFQIRDVVILTRRPTVLFDGPAFSRRWTLVLSADGVPYYVHYMEYRGPQDPVTSRATGRTDGSGC